MTDHPTITPPLELVQEWYQEASLSGAPYEYEQQIAARAAQWGADQELEACCEWLDRIAYRQSLHIKGSHLRAARCSKPPSLKEQALAMLDDTEVDAIHYETIRRALETLPE